MSAQFGLVAGFSDRTQKVWNWFSGSPLLAARQKERAKTTGTVLTSTLNAVIWVIGLGAQTIVRDVLAGLFILKVGNRSQSG